MVEHFRKYIPYFLGLPPLLGLAPPPPPPPIRLKILISAPVSVSVPPSDKRLLQISLNVDQKGWRARTIFNQLTSKSLGLFFLLNILPKYMYAVQEIISS